jgi:peptidoglycan hydrolase-like protein with peptidoglycan-binding domain
MIDDTSTRQRCHILTSEDVITDKPISGPVGAGHGKPDDIRMVQRFLNALLPIEGGPDLILAEDGICGPKTQAAINKYQKFAVGFVDGRIDPQGKTIRTLTGFIVGSPTVPQGPLGQNRAGEPAKDTPNVKVPLAIDAASTIADAQRLLRELEPRLNLLRFRLTRVTPPMLGLLNKHFAAGNDTVKPGDIAHISTVLKDIHFFVARASATGQLPVNNVLQFDDHPDPDFNARTVFGGDKLSSEQFVIVFDEESKRPVKAHGQSIWLSRFYAIKANDILRPTNQRQKTLLHEFCHFVGPTGEQPGILEDIALIFRQRFPLLSKLERLHNADTLALFFLEWCVGHVNVSSLPALVNPAHFAKFPRVNGATGQIEVGN